MTLIVLMVFCFLVSLGRKPSPVGPGLCPYFHLYPPPGVPVLFSIPGMAAYPLKCQGGGSALHGYTVTVIFSCHGSVLHFIPSLSVSPDWQCFCSIKFSKILLALDAIQRGPRRPTWKFSTALSWITISVSWPCAEMIDSIMHRTSNLFSQWFSSYTLDSVSRAH